MLAEARRTLPDRTFVEADLAAWEPETPPDLIYANAVLQWLPDHAALLPRLAGSWRRAAASPCRCPTTSTNPRTG